MLRAARPTSGYTLLELVLVLAILAIALGVVAPALSGFGSGRKTDEAATRFIALTRYARSQAISDGCPYRVVIDTATGACRVQVQQIDTFEDVEGRSFTAAEGVTIETSAPIVEGMHAIDFSPLGRSQPADVVFSGKRGHVMVSCDLPIEEYRVINDAEVGS